MAKDTRLKLIQTAKELIGSSSYASVGVAEICKQAGVNKGSFYHFFESKEELAIVALNDEFELNKVILDEIFSATKPAMQQLDEILELFANKQKEDYEKHGKICGCPVANLGSEMVTQKDTFSKCIISIVDKYELYMVSLVQKFMLEGLISKNTNAVKTGAAVHAYIMGIKVLTKLENNPKIITEDLKQVILNIIGVK